MTTAKPGQAAPAGGANNRGAKTGTPDGVVSSEFGELIAAISGSLELPADRLTPETRAAARAVIERTRGRIGLGLHHTVVALAGATGSGKSSLFNAISGLDIATVGVRRPTTAKPSACVWGEGGAEILEWLEVPAQNRTWRESALDADDEKPLHGLILLDLPDHDSTALEHRRESDRLVELVDLLIWVVDPQKYADNALHEHYLKPLARHSDVMVVVLNQIDRLQPEQQDSCARDLHRLLADDGLGDATVTLASAQTHEGIPELRSLLADAVAGREASTARVRADLESVATRIREELGEPAGDVGQLADSSGLIEAMVSAAGVPALVDTVRTDYIRRAYRATGWTPLSALQRLRPDPLGKAHGESTRAELIHAAVPSATKAQQARVNLSTHDLCVSASAGLTPPWKDAVFAAEKTSRGTLNESLDTAVMAVDLDISRPGWWGVVKGLQLFFFVLTVLAGLWLAAWGVFGLLQIPGPIAGINSILVPATLFLAGIVGSVVVCLSAASARRRGAENAAAKADSALRAAVTRVAGTTFLAPVVSVLEQHRAAHDSLAAASRGQGRVRQGETDPAGQQVASGQSGPRPADSGAANAGPAAAGVVAPATGYAGSSGAAATGDQGARA
ncbi:YfjP family GTPase [Saxibacter everestensis]|uniref:YfjP family GTPase n=1 Tax=Saxibacter everestensis TaxID=2909229 RepID=A0ABY8QNC6_9MICO|nr:YfjP family GTPase [Brevibacteriaceae bacterium ZFBP1038]